jgi:dephospho-CoA kinase
MRKVGITGGIGSGKTTVCRIFEMIGVPVYYADDRAKEILNTGTDVFNRVIEIFGKDILNQKGTIERKKLAALVFNDKEKLKQLNNIVHPAVGNDFKEWCKEYSERPYILKEAAILFESGAYKNVESVISVTAPVEMRIERVMSRDGSSKEDVLSRISRQMSEEERIERSDFVIANDETQLVIPQVLAIHKQLTSL